MPAEMLAAAAGLGVADAPRRAVRLPVAHTRPAPAGRCGRAPGTAGAPARSASAAGAGPLPGGGQIHQARFELAAEDRLDARARAACARSAARTVRSTQRCARGIHRPDPLHQRAGTAAWPCASAGRTRSGPPAPRPARGRGLHGDIRHGRPRGPPRAATPPATPGRTAGAPVRTSRSAATRTALHYDGRAC